MRTLPYYIAALVLAACTHATAEQEQAATRFAQAYYNWQFVRAAPLCTAEGQRHLALLATNTTQADIDRLRLRPDGAEVEIADLETLTDTTALLTVRVSRALVADTIGRPAREAASLEHHYNMVCRHGQWLIDFRPQPLPHPTTE